MARAVRRLSLRTLDDGKTQRHSCGERRAQQTLAQGVGGRRVVMAQLSEPGLHPTLVLDSVAARVAQVDVLPGALLLGLRKTSVEQRTDARPQVSDHEALPSTGMDSVEGPE